MSETIRTLPQRQFVLKDGDTFLVTDAWGDLGGEGDGLFHNDTRILATFRLILGDRRPVLLSTHVSQDNVYFTAHLSNHPLPMLGASHSPQGIVHIERKRLLWQGRLYERLQLVNYGSLQLQVPLSLRFSADFCDMFEVRGQQRERRGEAVAADLGERAVRLCYRGLDGALRCSALSFSQKPLSLDAGQASFVLEMAGGASWTLFIEVGDEVSLPSEERFRQASAGARRGMRRRWRHGAQIKVSGRLFQGWIDRSRSDLALLTTDLPTGPYPYAGIPWFSTPFGRDAIITALQMLWLDPEIARGVLSFLAQHQATETSLFRDSEPGKIMHETRKGEMSLLDELPFGRYYGGVDTTPLFVMLAGAYAHRTGDREVIDGLWPALNAAVLWVERRATQHPLGLLSYARGESSGLLNQGWKDSDDSVFDELGRIPDGPIALVEVQGYAYAAYRAMSDLAAWRGDVDAAVHWRHRALQLREAVERHFWVPELRFYALALDGSGRPCRVRASNAGHLLFCGLPKASRGCLVAQQLQMRSFNSGWGIRTLATEAPRYNPMSYHNGSVWPHDVALCAAGLARYGERDGVVRLLAGMFEAATRFGMRLPELFCGFEREPGEAPIAYPVACLPQAWAAGCVFMLLQACLGLDVDGRQRTIEISQARLPLGIDQLRIRSMKIHDTQVDLAFQRVGGRVVAWVECQRGGEPIAVQVKM